MRFPAVEVGGRADKTRARRDLRPGVERLESLQLMSADAVLRWNSVALDAVAADYNLVTAPSQAGPTATARALAIVQIAVYDAVNCIDHTAEPYLLRMRMPHDASVDAAVAEAAHDTLVSLYPRQRAMFDAALSADLAAIPDGRAERLGVWTGHMAALTMLAARAHDGANVSKSYNQPVVAGSFQPFAGEPTPLGTNWGHVKPFSMDTVQHFLAPPPPSITSEAYAQAYNEVKSLGAIDSTTRTPEQTQIGYFWGYDGTPGLGTPPRFYNQIAQVIARQQGNTLDQNARMFALANMALADAGIASWDTKYVYNYWRPLRGIRQVGPSGQNLDDGNPNTVADPSWTPLGAPCTNCPPGKTGFTPPFPSYTSGHAAFGAAFFGILSHFYGRDDITFSVMSDEFNGINKNPDGSVRPVVTRTYTSFSQAAAENAQSRIYLGIHWGFDRDEGIKQGNAVADYVFQHDLEATSHLHSTAHAKATSL